MKHYLKTGSTNEGVPKAVTDFRRVSRQHLWKTIILESDKIRHSAKCYKDFLFV